MTGGSLALSLRAKLRLNEAFFFLDVALTLTHTVVSQRLLRLMSQQRSPLNQIPDVFSRGHDPITHAHRAR